MCLQAAPPSLQRLHLAANGLQWLDSRALGRFPQLSVLDLSANRLTHPSPSPRFDDPRVESAAADASAGVWLVGGLPGLQVLDLSANPLGRFDADLLGRFPSFVFFFPRIFFLRQG